MTELEKELSQSYIHNLCVLLNARQRTIHTLDYTGKRTTKYVIEFDTPEESDSSESDVAGSDSGNT